MQLLARCRGSVDDRKLSARLLQAGVVSRPLSNMLYHRSGEQGLFLGFAAWNEKGDRPGRAHPRAGGALRLAQAQIGSAILRDRTRDEVIDRRARRHARRRMPGAPDVAPALRVGFRARRGRCPCRCRCAARREIVGIETGGDDRWSQHAGLQAGESGCQQNVVGAALDQHRLVACVRHAFARGDEFCAHVGEVAAERFAARSARPSLMPPASTMGRRRTRDRADEGERIEPAGLPAGARGQEHQAIGAGRHRALGVMEGGDVGKNERAGVVQRRSTGAGDLPL